MKWILKLMVIAALVAADAFAQGKPDRSRGHACYEETLDANWRPVDTAIVCPEDAAKPRKARKAKPPLIGYTGDPLGDQVPHFTGDIGHGDQVPHFTGDIGHGDNTIPRDECASCRPPKIVAQGDAECVADGVGCWTHPVKAPPAAQEITDLMERIAPTPEPVSPLAHAWQVEPAAPLEERKPCPGGCDDGWDVEERAYACVKDGLQLPPSQKSCAEQGLRAARWPTSAVAWLVLDSTQAKYPGNEHLKPCQPGGEVSCYDPSLPHLTYHLYGHKDACEAWEGAKCASMRDGEQERWVPIGRVVVEETK